MIALACERGTDIRRLRYATMDNTLRFPAWGAIMLGPVASIATNKAATTPPSESSATAP
ncbi:hypothetical protein AS19_08620 [Alcanivorax sp. NBRC 101098]|nr:hypothetical protein AS19_08620 [Alcanivorax sp. NBRC 101098]